MKKIMGLILGTISLFGANYTEIPDQYATDIVIESPKISANITTDDSRRYVGQAVGFSVSINGSPVPVVKNRFDITIPLSQLGQQIHTLTFTKNNDTITLSRPFIKLKNPNNQSLSQNELAFINTRYASPKIRSSELNTVFRRSELAFFLSELSNSKPQQKTVTIANRATLPYPDAIQSVVNRGILSLTATNAFESDATINRLVLIASIIKTLDVAVSTSVYPSVAAYKGTWVYGYLNTALDMKLLTNSDIPLLKTPINHATFIQIASRLPHVQSDIQQALTLPQQAVVQKKPTLPSKTLEKPSVSQGKPPAVRIESVDASSSFAKKIIGYTNPNVSFVVNWSRITSDDTGQFNVLIPIDMNDVSFHFDNGVIRKELPPIRSKKP
jgi:hypothetical protein